jgi:hypothetical protein
MFMARGRVAVQNPGDPALDKSTQVRIDDIVTEPVRSPGLLAFTGKAL